MSVTTEQGEPVTSRVVQPTRWHLRQRVEAFVAWCRTGEARGLFVLLAVAALIRCALAPYLIITGDLVAYERWGELMSSNFFHIYSFGAATASSWTVVPAYPPVALYMFGFVTKVYFGLGALLGRSPSHDVVTSHILRLALKLPEILADLLFLAFIYLKGLKIAALPRPVHWLAAATYALSPGIIITAVMWGQTDGVVLLLLALGLFLTARRQPIWSGVFLALAVSFKPTPVIFVPLALVYLYRYGGIAVVARSLAALAGTTVLVWLPYLLPPSFEVLAFLHNVKLGEEAEGFTATRGAASLWEALGLPWQNATVPFFGPLSITQTGILLFGIVFLVVLVALWFDAREARLWAGAAIVAYAFFTLTTYQFERYLFPALGLFFLAALYNRRYWVVYAAATLTFMLNFENTIFGCQCEPVTLGWPVVLKQGLMLHTNIWEIALVNCCALIFALATYLRGQRKTAREWAGMVLRPWSGTDARAQLDAAAPDSSLLG